MIGIIIIVALTVLGAIAFSLRPAKKELGNSSPKALSTPLSTASKRIISLYYSLPVDSQRLDGLENSLRALDIKHGVENVNTHFMAYEFPYTQQGKREFSWKPSVHFKVGLCSSYRCSMAEYYEIYSGIEGIKKDLAEQERAFEIAGVQDELDNLAAIRKKIREERGIIQETTREYT